MSIFFLLKRSMNQYNNCIKDCMKAIASYKITMYGKVITAALHEIGKHYSILTVYPSGHI